jgi:hypothetical protein
MKIFFSQSEQLFGLENVKKSQKIFKFFFGLADNLTQPNA